MKPVSKNEIKKLLKSSPPRDLLNLLRELRSKEELIDLIVSHPSENLGRALWSVLGWRYNIKD